MAVIQVGVFPPSPLGAGPEVVGGEVRAAAASGLDHVCVGDHVSFLNGFGMDGLVDAAMLLASHPTIGVHTGVYLLPLRHPVLVARQLADLAAFAPGRLVFGIGVGGEDPHEVSSCGVDPRTRGRRTDACLTVIRGLLAGDAVTHHDEFFDLDEVLITPVPTQPVPIIVGGRSDAAVRRAARYGDGWLGVWCSARRFGEVVDLVAAEAGTARRGAPPDRHAMQVWCGLAETEAAAAACLAPAMERFYQLPFERFARYCPAGPPELVADFLAPYIEAGCRSFNLIPQSPDAETALAGAAEVRRLLSRAS